MKILHILKHFAYKDCLKSSQIMTATLQTYSRRHDRNL